MDKQPLQNRVRADGELMAVPQRGLFYGNRGGRIHDPESRTLLPTKRWATRQWICCVLRFKNRRRPIMGKGYTELFFLDEVTALAAGHRPCFECRRADAVAFALAWSGDGTRARAPDMDRVLHRQRLDNRTKRVTPLSWKALPVGAVTQIEGEIFAKSDAGPQRWSFDGYRQDTTSQFTASTVDCLTPPAIIKALKNGYQPHWHPSAELG